MGGRTTASAGDGIAQVLPVSTTPWYRQRHLLHLNLCLASCMLLSAGNGYDGSMMNGLNALPQWRASIDEATGSFLGFINAAQVFGSVCNLFFVSPALQRFGRKKCIYVAYVYLIIGVTLQTAAPNRATFIVGRWFMGGVTAFFGSSAPLLITESAYPSHRGIVTALYNCGWYVGSLLAAWVTFGTRNYAGSWSWRIPSLVQCAIPLFSLTGILLAPESPRWLISVGRHEEARAMLTKYHAGGDMTSSLVDFEMQEIENTLTMEREAMGSASYLDLFKTKGNRHRLFITITLGFFAQWNGVGVVSYYLSEVLDTVGITDVYRQTLLNGFIQLWNLILAITAAFSVDRFGRRPLFLLSCGGMLVSFIVITALSGSFAHTGASSTGIAVIPFLFLYYGFYDIAFTPFLFAYPVEIWEYSLRARGLVVAQVSTNLALFFNIFVNGIALEAIAWKYYIVFVVLLVVLSIIVYLAYPETRGYSLEEIAFIFDRDQALVPSTSHVLSAVDGHQNEKAKTAEYVETVATA